MHENHRARMRKRFSKLGLAGFSEHEIIEMLLFYAIPRKNTNEIAHDLVKRFGNLRGILQASEAELCTVQGISFHSALYFRFLLELYGHFCRQGITKGEQTVFDGTEELLAYVSRYYLDRQTESPLLLTFDKNGVLLSCTFLDEGGTQESKLFTANAMKIVVEEQAATILLFHKHPDGSIHPSEEDLRLTQQWIYLFKNMNCPLEEHYILTDTLAYGILQKQVFDLPKVF